MNREIKFRAWDKKNKVFGFFKLENYFIEGHEEYGDIEAHINTWRYKKGALGDMGNYFEFEIDGHSVENYEYQQYTNLKDKNGKEIYEGDITITENSPEEKYVVVFENGGFILEGDEHKWLIRSAMDYGIEIIGNIYEK